MLTLDDVLAPVPGVVSRESDGEMVIVLPEQGKFVVLNETGAEMFQLLDGKHSVEEIAAALSGHYNIPLEQVQADVLALAEKLLGRGAVRRQEEDLGSQA